MVAFIFTDSSCLDRGRIGLDAYLVRTRHIPGKYESCEACVCVCVVHHRLGGSLPAQAKEEEEVGGGEEKGNFLCAILYDYLLSVLLSRTESSSIRRKEELIERMFRGGCKHVQIGLAYPFFLGFY